MSDTSELPAAQGSPLAREEAGFGVHWGGFTDTPWICDGDGHPFGCTIVDHRLKLIGFGKPSAREGE